MDTYIQTQGTRLHGSSGQQYWRVGIAHGVTSETILKPTLIDCGVTGVKLVRPDEEVTRDMRLSSWFYGVCV